MDAQEAKAEAEGQQPNLLGRRCRRKLLREGVRYVGTTALWGFAGWSVNANSIKPAFYSAAATIVPVLLLALLLRFGQARDQIADIGASVDRTEGRKRELAAKSAQKLGQARQGLHEIEAQLPDEGGAAEDLHSQIGDLREKVAAVEAETEEALGPDPYFSGIRLHRLSEENFAGLLLALAIGALALYAILITLGAGDSTIVAFAVTASALSWLLLEIARLEIRGFATEAWVNQSGEWTLSEPPN